MSLEKCAVKHLFLVMGTNPLPNYVASRLLTKKDAQIYLIHSSDVGEICRNFTDVLKEEGFNNPVYIEVDESNGDDIFSKIKNTCENLNLTDVGLNYTGGTKAMAVHSYRALKEIVPGAFFYYLDPREMVFMIEQNGAVRKTKCLQNKIQVNISQMIKLHGYDINNEQKDPIYSEPQFPELAETMGKHLDIIVFRKWCSDNLRGTDPKAPKKGNQLITKFKNSKPETCDEIPLPTAPDGTYSIWNGHTIIGDLATELKTNSYELVRYLDGLWVEDYVLLCMKNISKKNNNTRLDSARNLCAAKQIDKTNNVRKFQLDCFAIIGYQLFGISCGSGHNKGELKLKLFEVMLRSTQIGGDEARFALVCGHEQPNTIEDEINNVWDTKGNLRVFGAKDLPELEERLLDWFKDQPGGAF